MHPRPGTGGMSKRLWDNGMSRSPSGHSTAKLDNYGLLKLSLILQQKIAYALPNSVHYKFSLFYRSRICFVQLYKLW